MKAGGGLIDYVGTSSQRPRPRLPADRRAQDLWAITVQNRPRTFAPPRGTMRSVQLNGGRLRSARAPWPLPGRKVRRGDHKPQGCVSRPPSGLVFLLAEDAMEQERE